MMNGQKRILFVILICMVSTAARAGDTTFNQFAQHQSDLFQKAYEARDTVTYHALLGEFLDRYDGLSQNEKKMYASYYNNAYYNFCCTYSLLHNKEAALDYFDKAVEAGFIDYAHIMTDPDLENIRGEARFQSRLVYIRSVGDYMYILHSAATYNASDRRPLPVFTYAAPTDTNLVALRKAFHLDSIAGTGNDVSQVIALLHWIHNLVPHDGNNENPAVKNALSMVAVCQRDHRGLNCRGLATVLNECYLAMGFKSRFVTCLPKDSLQIDGDCHVINMVFIPSLHKWVWMDPTNDAYVMDDQGQLLGLAEVRERLVDGKVLIVNPDANWNHRQSTVKEDYLYHYMAKNLYLLECPTAYQFDTETNIPGKVVTYIDLVPLDYFRQGPDKNEHHYPKMNVTYITYKTNNPEAFWAAPQ